MSKISVIFVSISEKMGKTKPLTVNEVNQRVEELSENMKQGMAEIKSLLSMSSVSTSTSDNAPAGPNVDILNSFKKFESEMYLSLEQLKSDINVLKEESNTTSNRVKNIELKNNYNYIIIHGFAENDNSDLLQDVIQLISDKVNIQVKKEAINACYRIGKKTPDKKKPRPVAVLFTHRWLRDDIFFNKKKLKGSRIMFTELLTVDNLKLFKRAREVFDTSVWTFRGLVYVSQGGVKKLIRCNEDITEMQS